MKFVVVTADKNNSASVVGPYSTVEQAKLVADLLKTQHGLIASVLPFQFSTEFLLVVKNGTVQEYVS